MSIPTANLHPNFNITRTSHVVLTVADLSASRAFYVDALGLVVTEESAGTLYLRGMEEACHHSLVLKRTTDAPQCERIGMRVFDDDHLDRMKSQFDEIGLPAEWVERPYQGRTLHVTDPVGTKLEFCAHMDVVPRKIVDFARRRGPCPQRVDHYQILTPNVQLACEFYMQTLGFRLSEYVAFDGTDEFLFVFMQRKGSPHDIVFAVGDGPRLHHFAFSVPEIAHLIYACDIAGSLGLGTRLEHGPGRHGPGHAVFVYFRDPDGHRVELFNTHYQIIDLELSPVRWDASYLRKRPWGLPARRRWYTEASPFTGSDVQAAKPGNSLTLEQYLLDDPPFV